MNPLFDENKIELLDRVDEYFSFGGYDYSRPKVISDDDKQKLNLIESLDFDDDLFDVDIDEIDDVDIDDFDDDEEMSPNPSKNVPGQKFVPKKLSSKK
jgi:hypothetical protein